MYFSHFFLKKKEEEEEEEEENVNFYSFFANMF